MDRINGAGHVAHRFVTEDVATARPPTEITADWLNGIQEELAAVIESESVALSNASWTQLLGVLNTKLARCATPASVAAALAGAGYMNAAAVNDAIAAALAGYTPAVQVPTGVIVYAIWAAPKAGWLRLDGRTIGNAASGATSRANADCWPLYEDLWNTHSNTVCPIETSGGGATARGASAAADWAANKRLPLVDSRGAVLCDLDDGAGRDGSGRVQGSYLPESVGPHTHPLWGVSSALANSTVDGFGNGPSTAISGEESGTHAFIQTNAAGEPLMQAPPGATQNKVRDVAERAYIKM